MGPKTAFSNQLPGDSNAHDVVVQSCDSAIPQTAACQASLSLLSPRAFSNSCPLSW